MRNSNFVSWLGQMLLGLALFLGGAEVASAFWRTWWEVAAAGGMACALGLGVAFRAELADRPQRLLRRAKSSLNFPTQWAVKFDKCLPQGDVIPVSVIRSDGVRFVIDIQGLREVDWCLPGDGQWPLVGPGGKKFKTNPIGPLMKAASAWGATAVLWLPEAKTARNLRQDGCELIVVMGSARDLKNALRAAEIVPIRREASAAKSGAEPPAPPPATAQAHAPATGKSAKAPAKQTPDKPASKPGQKTARSSAPELA